MLSFSPMRTLALLSVLSFSFTAGAASGALPPPLLGKLIDVGGYRVHLYCTGAGGPTVMVVGGGFSFDWGLVQPKVAEFTRICTYDPSGTAWSDPFPVFKAGGTPNCRERIEEIHKLLKNADVEGPYVLVGFSIGGLISRLYASYYPEEVAGMIIVDHAFIDTGGDSHAAAPHPRTSSASDHSDGPLAAAQLDSAPVLIHKEPISLGIEDDRNFSKLPQRDRELHLWAMSLDPVRPTAEAAAECIAAVESVTKKRAYPLGGMPLIVVSTTYDAPNYRSLQTELLSLSHDSRHFIAENSTHMVIIDQPEIIVTAIQKVVRAVQNRTSVRSN